MTAALLQRAAVTCSPSSYAMTEQLLASACGLDERTWRRWKRSWPTRGANRALVVAILEGWLRVYEADRYPGWPVLQAWRSDPVQLARRCLAAGQAANGQLTATTPAADRPVDRKQPGGERTTVRPRARGVPFKGRARIIGRGAYVQTETLELCGWSRRTRAPAAKLAQLVVVRR